MNVSKYLYLILFLFLFITCKEDDGPQLATYSFTSDFPIVHQKIDDIIKREFAYQNMVGLNVAVIQNGQVIHRKGYGYRDAGSLLPVTTENVFYMNSISKPITAVLAQLLSDYLEDDFNWDDPIINHSTYYATAPCNAINDGWRNLITTKGLLSNTAGVPHYCEVFWENGSTTYANGGGWKGTMESTRLIDVFCHAPLLMPQSANQYRYSSFGYNLAGCVINDVGKEHLNKGYYELADEWLRDGWGMNNLVPDDGARPGKPLRYSMSCVGEVFVEPNTEDRTWALPGSGWLINPNDLAKFGNHLLEGKVQTDQLWESVGNIPEIGCDGDNLGNNPRYTHGFTRYNDTATVYGHGGSHPDGGAKSQLWINQSDNIVIVGMTNTDWWQWDRIRRQIEDELKSGSRNTPAYNYTRRMRCDSSLWCNDKTGKIFTGIFVDDIGNLRSPRYGISKNTLKVMYDDMKECNFAPIDIDYRPQNDGTWNALFAESTIDTRMELDQPAADEQDFIDAVSNYESIGMEPSDIEIYRDSDNKLKWAGIFEETNVERVAVFEMTNAEFNNLNSSYTDLGYLPIDIEVYKNNQDITMYACIWEEMSGTSRVFVNENDPNDGSLPTAVQNAMATTGMQVIDQEYLEGNRQAFILHSASTNTPFLGIGRSFCGLQTDIETQIANGFWLVDLEEK